MLTLLVHQQCHDLPCIWCVSLTSWYWPKYTSDINRTFLYFKTNSSEVSKSTNQHPYSLPCICACLHCIHLSLSKAGHFYNNTHCNFLDTIGYRDAWLTVSIPGVQPHFYGDCVTHLLIIICWLHQLLKSSQLLNTVLNLLVCNCYLLQDNAEKWEYTTVAFVTFNHSHNEMRCCQKATILSSILYVAIVLVLWQ